MNKFLLATMSLALTAGTMNAQSQMKQIAPVAKKSTLFAQGTMKLGELTVLPSHATRAGEGIDPKVLSNMPGWDRGVYEANGLRGNQGDTLQVGTFYSPSLLARFNGNKITNIKTLVGPNMKKLNAFILDAQTGQVLWEGKTLIGKGGETTSKSKMIEFKCDYVIDQSKPIVVAWQGVMKSNETAIGAVLNIVNSGLLIGNGKGFRDLTNANGFVAYLDCETEGEAGLKKNDVEVLDITGSRAVANGEAPALATIMNYGTEPVKKLASTYTVAGKESNSEVPVEGEGFPYMAPIQLTLNAVAPAVGARYQHDFIVSKVNDVDDEYAAKNVLTEKLDNVASNILTVTEKAYDRVAVMEQYTGTWCGWCPRGHVAMEKAEKTLGDKFIGIAVHANDPMQADEYAPFINFTAQYGGFPSAMINRIGYSLFDPYYGSEGIAQQEGKPDGDILNDLKYINSIPGEAQVGLSSDFSEDGNSIDITGMFRFGLKCDGYFYSVAYVLTEDGINGIPQENYYHESQGKVPSADVLPEDLKFLYTEGKAGKYMPTFNNVARSIKDPEGIEGSLDGFNIVAGKTFTHTYTMPVPKKVVKKENLKLVALLIDKLTNEIVTAQEAKIGEMVWDEAAGVEQITADKAEIAVVNGGIQVTGNGNVGVYSVDGKLVRSAAVNGSEVISVQGLKGTYVVRVVGANGVTVKKVML